MLEKTKIQKQRTDIKRSIHWLENRFDSSLIDDEKIKKLPEVLLEEYFKLLQQSDDISLKIKKETDKWVDINEQIIKLEKCFDKVLEGKKDEMEKI